MTGIQFITDEKSRKTAAIIDLKRHRTLWEDIEDVLASRLRQHEKRIPIEKVKADLRMTTKDSGGQRVGGVGLNIRPLGFPKIGKLSRSRAVV